MERARKICLSQKRTNIDIASDNYFSRNFIDVYIMSATALEAFINERISIIRTIIKQRIAMKVDNSREDAQISTDENQRKIIEMLKEQDVVTKYRMMPVLLWQKSFDEGRSPFKDFVTLIKIRNDIIHYKMTFYDEKSERPKWAKTIEGKGIFLREPVVSPPEPLPNEGRRIWIDEICTFKGAKWAYNTSCQMMKKFAGLSQGIIQATCQDYVGSFKEI